MSKQSNKMPTTQEKVAEGDPKTAEYNFVNRKRAPEKAKETAPAPPPPADAIAESGKKKPEVEADSAEEDLERDESDTEEEHKCDYCGVGDGVLTQKLVDFPFLWICAECGDSRGPCSSNGDSKEQALQHSATPQHSGDSKKEDKLALVKRVEKLETGDSKEEEDNIDHAALVKRLEKLETAVNWLEHHRRSGRFGPRIWELERHQKMTQKTMEAIGRTTLMNRAILEAQHGATIEC